MDSFKIETTLDARKPTFENVEKIANLKMCPKMMKICQKQILIVILKIVKLKVKNSYCSFDNARYLADFEMNEI